MCPALGQAAGHNGRKTQTSSVDLFVILQHQKNKTHNVIFINPIFPDAISLENTSVTSATAYRLASIPLPDSSNIFSEVKAANAPIPDSVANCAELSSPNLSVILSAATPETFTLFAPSV